MMALAYKTVTQNLRLDFIKMNLKISKVKFSSCQLENFRVENNMGFWKKVWSIAQFFTKVSQYIQKVQLLCSRDGSASRWTFHFSFVGL